MVYLFGGGGGGGWGACKKYLDPIHKIQRKIVCLIISNVTYHSLHRPLPHSAPLFHTRGLLNIHDMFKLISAKFVFTCLKLTSPLQFAHFYIYALIIITLLPYEINL